MDNIVKGLVAAAVVAFVLAIVVVLTGRIMNISGESFSRASANLTLIAIALMLMNKRGSLSSG